MLGRNKDSRVFSTGDKSETSLLDSPLLASLPGGPPGPFSKRSEWLATGWELLSRTQPPGLSSSFNITIEIPSWPNALDDLTFRMTFAASPIVNCGGAFSTGRDLTIRSSLRPIALGVLNKLSVEIFGTPLVVVTSLKVTEVPSCFFQGSSSIKDHHAHLLISLPLLGNLVLIRLLVQQKCSAWLQFWRCLGKSLSWSTFAFNYLPRQV